MNDATHDDAGDGLLDALIEGERAALTSSGPAERRTWKRVASSVAVGAPLPVEPMSIAGPAASATWAAPWLKVVLALVFGSAVAAGGYGLLARDDLSAPATDERDAAADEPRGERPAATPGHAPALPEPATSPEPPEPPEPPEVESTAAVAPGPIAEPAGPELDPPSARAAPRPPTRPTPSDLAEETRLLARARAHLRSAAPQAALAPLDEHARRFPDGQLAEDRMVLRAQALCESGDTDAGRRQAAALQRAFPRSSHLPRVRRACD
jgi:hypothetical protein